MAASMAGRDVCVECGNSSDMTNRSVLCGICDCARHYECAGIKEVVALEVKRHELKGILFICAGCWRKIESIHGEGTKSCSELTRDGVDERREMRSENEAEKNARRTRSKTKAKCGKCNKLVDTGDKKLECEVCGINSHSRCLGIRDEVVMQIELQSKKIIGFVCKKCQEGIIDKLNQHNDEQESEEVFEETHIDGNGKGENDDRDGENDKDESGEAQHKENAENKQLEEKNAENKYVENDVLVYVAAKINKLPRVEVIKHMVFYTKDEIGVAKRQLYEECLKHGAREVGLKYEDRKNSGRRAAHEVEMEDIYDFMIWLQGRVEDEDMPIFVTSNIENLPVIENTKQEEAVKKMNERLTGIKEEIEKMRREEKERFLCTQKVMTELSDMKKRMERVCGYLQKIDENEQGRIEVEKWRNLEQQSRLDKIENTIKFEFQKFMEDIKTNSLSGAETNIASRPNIRHEGRKDLKLTYTKNGHRKIVDLNDEQNISKENDQHTENLPHVEQGNKTADEKQNVESEEDREMSDRNETIKRSVIAGRSLNQVEQVTIEDDKVQRKVYSEIIQEFKKREEGVVQSEAWHVQRTRNNRGRNRVQNDKIEKVGELKACSRPAKCYVGKCSMATTVDGMKKYVQEIVLKETGNRVDCAVVELKKEGVMVGWSKSYLVTIPVFVKPLLLIERFWPPGIIIRNFYEKKRIGVEKGGN